MTKQFYVRYGSTHIVILAIILPCLSIVPFVLVMQLFKPLPEWLVFFIILAFLGGLVLLVLWLVKSVYPKAILTLNEKKISLRFKQGNFLSPADFSFCPADVTSLKIGDLRGDDYMRFKLKNPVRKFQLTAGAYGIEEYLAFNEAMVEISEMVSVEPRS
jgi:hypothetical protein